MILQWQLAMKQPQFEIDLDGLCMPYGKHILHYLNILALFEGMRLSLF